MAATAGGTSNSFGASSGLLALADATNMQGMSTGSHWRPSQDVPMLQTQVDGNPGSDAQTCDPEEVIKDINAEVALLEGKKLRHKLRQLQFYWHPDRAWQRDIRSNAACKVFGFVQEIWETRVLTMAVVA